jgi:tripartite-type tricarboxylate transporter receptor subunit TctC
MTAQNWAYVRAPRDGSTILATYSALIEANLLGNKKAQFDVRKFNWVGSVASSPNGCMTWHTSPYKDIRQLVGKEVTASATGSTGKSATMPMLINELLGTKIKVITGYRTTETVLALERGEVDIICGLGYYTLAASNPDMITNKKIQYVVQTGLHSLEELKGTPNLLDLTTGKDRQLLEYIAILEELGRPYLAPPEVPAERLAAIRTAFAAAINDPELRTEFKKMNLNVTPIAGTEMEKMIAKLYSFPADVIERQARINGQRK